MSQDRQTDLPWQSTLRGASYSSYSGGFIWRLFFREPHQALTRNTGGKSGEQSNPPHTCFYRAYVQEGLGATMEKAQSLITSNPLPQTLVLILLLKFSILWIASSYFLPFFFLPIHLSMDTCVVSRSWLLWIILQRTWGISSRWWFNFLWIHT